MSSIAQLICLFYQAFYKEDYTYFSRTSQASTTGYPKAIVQIIEIVLDIL
jgi:hypothetical protein